MMGKKTWSLKRTVQCAKCPWRKDVDPNEIPNGYSREQHEHLAYTIAEPGACHTIGDDITAMACHETQDAHCVGWVMNQVGVGNNIPLRLKLMSCANAKDLRTVGEQHERFEDTLPEA